MKTFYSILATVLFSVFTINAQNYQSGSITTNNNETFEGRVAIDNSSEKVLFKKNNESKTYKFNAIKSVIIGNRTYKVFHFKDTDYLANQLQSGIASLYDLSNLDYLILMNYGTEKKFNLDKNKSKIPGTLSLLFNNCNEIRNQINNKVIDEKALMELTTFYNNCSYSSYTPTEKEIENAKTNNTDLLRFYAGIQTSFNGLTVNDKTESSQGFGFGFGIGVSPSFVGKAQGNLYFDFDVSLLFTGDKDFKGQGFDLNFNNNSYRFSLGAEYLFNKKGTVKPFIGINYGYTMDYYKGVSGTVKFKDNKQNYFFLPKVGMLFQIENGNHIGVTLSYISEYENNLSFNYDDIFHPLVVKNDFIIVGLNYSF